MFELFQAGGIWNVVITISGFFAIAMGIRQFTRRGKRDYGALIAGLTTLTLCLSILAYGLGMWNVVGMVTLAEPLEAAATMSLAVGYASTALAWGGFMSTLSALVGGLAYHAHLNQRA